MSYDLYCYKSQLGIPDLEEAQNAIEIYQEDKSIEADPERKLRIAKALIEHNPSFEIFDFDYAEIAKIQGITIELAKQRFDHIELNNAEGELATQITIYNNNVAIVVPYWYSGDVAKNVFERVAEYTKVIRKLEGYFVFDPQTEYVYDPLINSFEGLPIYTNMTDEIERMKEEKREVKVKKAWWKFW